MHPVHLADMSKAVLSKLRNGHAVRAMLGAKGHGVGAILGEDNLKKLLKAGKRGAKAVIKLGAEELHANRAGGTGIMAGGKFSFKHAAKSVNKGLKSVAKNPIVQDVVSSAAGDLAAAAAPELGPLGYAGAAYGTKKAMDAYAGSGFVAGGALGHPDHVGGKLKMKKVGKTLKKVAGNKTVQSVAKKAAEAAIDAAMASGGEGLYAGRGASGGSAKRKVIDLIEDIGENRPRKRGESRVRQAIDMIESKLSNRGRGFVAGGAIGPSPGMTGITNVGAGGSLLCMRNPALRSQADSENFFFHTEFPPALAERMEGSGIYA